jgi:hypothetical protein
VQPAIVTPLSRGEVEADLEMAAQHGIAVVCRENLEAGINQINLPLRAEQIFQDVKKLVPVTRKSSLFPG